ncbi:MAG: hypothetical protein R3C17_17305 [Planctomycetaceae bacterium]
MLHIIASEFFYRRIFLPVFSVVADKRKQMEVKIPVHQVADLALLSGALLSDDASILVLLTGDAFSFQVGFVSKHQLVELLTVGFRCNRTRLFGPLHGGCKILILCTAGRQGVQTIPVFEF